MPSHAERQRLQGLDRIEAMDVEQDEELDQIVAVARRLLKVPVALVTAVGEREQRVLARVGTDLGGTPREHAFCRFAILDDRPLVVRDTLLDDRFRDHPLVVGEPHIRAYVGAPIVLHDGAPIGALCGVDHRPRDVDETTLQGLSALAEVVASHLEGRAVARRLVEEVLRSVDTAGREDLLFGVLLRGAQAIVDQACWPAAFAHVRVGGRAAVVTSSSLDGVADAAAEVRTVVEQIARLGSGDDAVFVPTDHAPAGLADVASLYGCPGYRSLAVRPRHEVEVRLGVADVVGARTHVESSLRELAGRLAEELPALHRVTPLEGHGEAARRVSYVETLRDRIQVGVTHHLHTPLTVVAGVAELLSQDPDLARDRPELLAALARNSTALKDLVTDLAAMGSSSSAFASERHPPCDVEPLVRAGIDRAVRFRDRDGTLSLESTPCLASVDAPRLTRAVTAMVDNAFRHGGPGVHVEVELHRVGSGRFRVTVADDGPGIADADKRRVFLPFEQGPDVSPSSPGMGIGLSLVAAVADQHGGRCHVADRPDGGTVVVLELPTGEGSPN